MQETFSIDIRPNPYNNERVEQGLQHFCEKTWSFSQFGGTTVYKGIYTGTEEELKKLLYPGAIWPAQDEVRFWRRPEQVFYTLRHNYEPTGEKRPWMQSGDISTTCWLLDPDSWQSTRGYNYLPEEQRSSYENAVWQMEHAYLGAQWLKDDYFHCECQERAELWKGK